MFGGLRKTSSRLTIAAAVGLLVGAITHVTPVKAADLGGDCCADLEERVAELEATTVRKGTKKVSLTISGWVTKALFFWDDGDEENVYIVDKFNTLASHIKFSGSAQISPGWSAGYLLHLEFPTGNGITDNQQDDNGPGLSGVLEVVAGNGASTGGSIFSGRNVYLVEELQSAIFLKSDQYGTVTLGKQSHTADNLALLPDLSGTIIESNAVIFEGNLFNIRPEGTPSGFNGQSGFVWGNFLQCKFAATNIIGTDCDGVPIQAIKYDSPTFMGFSTSSTFGEDDTWSTALKYAGDLGDFKTSAAIGYSEITDENYVFGAGGNTARREVEFFQVGASVLHVPTGLFLYGLYSHEEDNSDNTALIGLNIVTGAQFSGRSNDDSDTFYIKGGIKQTWTPWGATVVFGEYAEYEDMFARQNACGASIGTGPQTLAPNACAALGANQNIEISGSEVERWGLGVVQEVDAAALRLYARWQHLDLDVDFDVVTNGQVGGGSVSQGFEDLDIYMVGGTIFF